MYWKAGGFGLPLNQSVTFKTVLQRQGRFQVPKIVRWQFKLEPTEVLQVTVSVVDLVSAQETFFARMLKDGRIVVPKLTLALLKGDEPSLEGCALEVTLEPARR